MVVSYQYSNRCYLWLETDVLFVIFLNTIAFLAGRQYNFRTDADSIKREISIILAHDRFDFEKIEYGANASKIITDVVDILVIFIDTMLKSSGNVPLSDHRFTICPVEMGCGSRSSSTKSPLSKDSM
ncbi:MAG: hypothetical protein LBH02_03655 [Methanocalculaceae archaeon]|jgi:hypothetical protein|nr:hypothetical protein [Methanocalculaceae archaeon]